MTTVQKLIIQWLSSLTDITNQVGTRISILLDPTEGFPSLIVGTPGGAPVATPGKSVGRREVWTVPLYCIAGRRDSENDPLPDFDTAYTLANSLSWALGDLDDAHYVGTGGTITSGEIRTATPGTEAGNFARVAVTVKFTVWNTADRPS